MKGKTYEVNFWNFQDEEWSFEILFFLGTTSQKAVENEGSKFLDTNRYIKHPSFLKKFQKRS